MDKVIENMGSYSHLPKEIIGIIMTFIVGAVVIKILTALIRRMLVKSALDESAYVVILRSARIVLWVLVGLCMVMAAGVNPSPFIAVLASAGAALALALRDSLSNVAGGIIILFTRPFVKGDEIVVDNISGIVDFIDLMSTKLHTFSNQEITIPNSKMVNSIIVNRTGRDLVRVDCKFTVSYDSDLAKVRTLLNNIVRDGDVLLEEPAPVIGVSKHEKSGIVWDMYVWARTEDRFKAQYYLGEEVKNVFEANGISIPFPHVDVTIEGGDDNK